MPCTYKRRLEPSGSVYSNTNAPPRGDSIVLYTVATSSQVRPPEESRVSCLLLHKTKAMSLTSSTLLRTMPGIGSSILHSLSTSVLILQVHISGHSDGPQGYLTVIFPSHTLRRTLGPQDTDLNQDLWVNLTLKSTPPCRCRPLQPLGCLGPCRCRPLQPLGCLGPCRCRPLQPLGCLGPCRCRPLQPRR